MSQSTHFRPETLERFVVVLMTKLGLPNNDARTVASALVQADLGGVPTHGLGRLPNYIARLQKGLVNPRPAIRFVREFGATALLDADNAMGQVAAAHAMRSAIRMAEEFGIGLVAVRGSNHFGAASFYCDMAVAAGMVGLALSNTPPGMAPHGGRAAFLGTNPIGIGIPTDSAPPISIDMATSTAARGHVLKAQREGRSIPLGWAVDAAGEPTSDPDAALAGALLPLGGAKGYGLALAVEVLCGVLAGAAVGPEMPSFFDDWEQPSNVGHVLGAINVGAFAEPRAFRQRTDQLIHDIKQVPPAAGFEAVLVPGERRARTAAQRRSQGVELASATIAQLNRLAEELGLPLLAADAP